MPADDRISRRLKLRDLHTFCTVVQKGSMVKAAADLALTQPAVSRAISDMEDLFGLPLLDRKARGVEPTLYGRALVKWGATLFDDVREAVRQVQSLADPTSGELSISGPEPMVAGLLPAVVARLCARYPKIAFRVMHSPSVEQQYNELRHRKVDLVIGRLAHPVPEDLQAEFFFDDPVVVAVGRANELGRRRKIRLSNLIDEAWVLPGPDTPMGAFVLRMFRAAGFEIPKNAMFCNSLQFVHAILENGTHIGMFAASVLYFSGNRYLIKALPVKLATQPPPVGFLTLKGQTLSPVVKLFVDCAREVASPFTDCVSKGTLASAFQRRNAARKGSTSHG